MIQTLNFVRGAVATKDVIPVMQSFHFYNGRVQGTNGRVTIDAPCPKIGAVDITVGATAFLKAVDACDGSPVLDTKEVGFLKVSHKSFKARLPLDNHSEFPRQEAAGDAGAPVAGSILTSLKTLWPFISEDASRPWACGVLFKDGGAYATNNVVLAGVPGYQFDMPLNLPRFLIEELLRINQEPTKVQATNDNITFSYSNNAWIKASLFSAEWPDVERMLPKAVEEAPIPEGLIKAVEKILPFCPDPKLPLVHLGEDGISTSEGAKSATVGGFSLTKSAFRAEPLLSVLRSAKQLDFSNYPKPCPFIGDNGLRGVLVGVQI